MVDHKCCIQVLKYYEVKFVCYDSFLSGDKINIIVA